jgi:hypothetical protein
MRAQRKDDVVVCRSGSGGGDGRLCLEIIILLGMVVGCVFEVRVDAAECTAGLWGEGNRQVPGESSVVVCWSSVWGEEEGSKGAQRFMHSWLPGRAWGGRRNSGNLFWLRVSVALTFTVCLRGE